METIEEQIRKIAETYNGQPVVISFLVNNGNVELIGTYLKSIDEASFDEVEAPLKPLEAIPSLKISDTMNYIY